MTLSAMRLRFTSCQRAVRGSWPALLFALVLSGCASTPAPTTHQYTLPQHVLVSPKQVSPNASLAGPTSPRVLMMPVQLAGQLQVNGLIIQTSPIEITEAHNNLWADALSNQLDRALYQAVSHRLHTASVISGDSSDVPAYYIALQVNQFQGRYDGKAVVSGMYRILDADRRLIKQHAFTYEEPLIQNGYGALVDALDKGVQRLADDVAVQLDALPPRQ